MLTQVEPKTVVQLLNQLVKLDQSCAQELFNTRIGCNDALAEHPKFVAMLNKQDSQPRLGLLGVINGFFREEEGDFGPIVMVLDDQSKKVLGFMINDPNAVPPAPAKPSAASLAGE